VHVVDIARPERPRKVAFIPAHRNSHPGEGVHLIEMSNRFFRGTVLIHNNEACGFGEDHDGGVSLWDVTRPERPRPLARGVGDVGAESLDRMRDLGRAHDAHSAQGWTAGDRAFVAMVDNEERKDVDILEITNPRRPRLIAERGLDDWPEAHAPLARGDEYFHHDMQLARIDGRQHLLVSYWDAGQILLDVEDPANPVYVRDFDYGRLDSLDGQTVPEGNAHQAYWSADQRFVLAVDEDFEPYSTALTIEGPGGEVVAASEIGLMESLSERHPFGLRGPAVWGGSGCARDVDRNGRVDRRELPPAAGLPARFLDARVVAFSHGGCGLPAKLDAARRAGYGVVLVGARHDTSGHGRRPDLPECGWGEEGQRGVTVLCVGHRALHRIFGDEPGYGGPEPHLSGGDMPPVGTRGAEVASSYRFDGWGQTRLLDARTLQRIDTWAPDEARDPRFAAGHGALSVHEVKTDPRPGVGLAYLSHYSAGLRVVAFGPDGLEEVGHWIGPGGSDFWGVFPHRVDAGPPLLLLSDRDRGLQILRYTGR